MIKTITEKDFEAEVIRSSTPVMVDFWATWCGKCKMLSGIIDQIAAAAGSAAKIVKVDVDKDMALARRFNVAHLPALLFFKNGELVSRIDDMTTKAAIVEHIKAML